ncbi:MAG: phytoene desaturase [Endomicrobiales bacterium]|nr:phytoene desaturase [Endomicrobiales bacterium]
MLKKKVIIVGAGPGGLTAGMLLSHRGFDVEIIEKEKQVGGRNAAIELGGYTFDTGPTFLMMNFILEEMFEMAGRKLEDYVTVKRLEPMYRLNFGDFEFLPVTDREEMKKRIEKLFPGNASGYDKFLKREKARYEKMYPCLKVDYSNWRTLLSKNLLKALPYLSLGRSLFGNLGDYFRPENLKLSFTFQAKYIGMSPWECPAAFTMIPYIEHSFGVYHVMGGLNRISHAMKKVVEEEGGRVRLGVRVIKLLVEKGKAKGVELDSGERLFADEVIINADFAHAMSTLAEAGVLKKYSRENLSKKRYSCSTFMLYLGLDKKYDIPHHNIFFSSEYRKNIEDIFYNKKLSDNMSFYVQNACVTDPSLAPQGGSTIYVLVPVANNTAAIDWETEKAAYREKVLDALAKRTELKDIKRHIKVEKVIMPQDWENSYNVYLGATFNLAHNLAQMMYFRPHNKFEEIGNCWLVGGGTHPGSGLPTIYESGRITSGMISSKYGVK